MRGGILIVRQVQRRRLKDACHVGLEEELLRYDDPDKRLHADHIHELCEPSGYLGSALAMIDQVLATHARLADQKNGT
ncbi:hypothetical protein GCM10012320_35240 [Sinomonas cellulolyticus]|uniref:Adenylosuccinate lyase n=1 Tax=Sinomonas cellulolyticus TaxID=2801916 RepID=A0ABS1K2F1_9MICC|nr:MULTISPECIES: hypothetical protein [Sinomonas]MBL0705087.1 hypothetical protein [Sinomonas cellulolyticus]GHG60604.1 hypothetical protein GCM10012320_35240 [Sinomonas sp. KCTC 49339]